MEKGVKGGKVGGDGERQAARDGLARVRRLPGPSSLVDVRGRGQGYVGDGGGRDEVGGGIGCG